MLDNEKPEKEREGKSSQELGESLFNNTPTQAVESDSDSKTGRKMNSEAETEAPAEENDSLLQETDDNVKYYYVQLSSESCTPATEERYAKKIEDCVTELSKVRPEVTASFSHTKTLTEKVMVNDKGKRKEVMRSLLPGYILVSADFSEEAGKVLKSYLRENVRGTTIYDAPVNPKELRKYKKEFVSHESDSALKPGTRVKLIGGAFKDFSGSVEQVSNNNTVKVAIEMFGRNTLIDASVSEIEKE